jgi:hypothetical protein
MESYGRTGAAAIWARKRLLVWGGKGARSEVRARGLAYDAEANRWLSLPPAPLSARVDPAAVWTGEELIVWGGGGHDQRLADGAAFAPATP